jgi:hypothetical protein
MKIRRIKDKRGQTEGGNAIGIIWFFAILLLILIIGFIAAMAVSVIDYTSGLITPIMGEIGVVGEYNVSVASGYTFGTMDSFVNMFPILVGVGYVCALIFSVIFAVSYTYNPNPIYIGFYFVLIILLIFGSIVMSNMYEDIYTSSDMMGDQLHEQTLLSYMILYSPMILTVIAFITGIFLFVGRPAESGGVI